MSNELNAVEHPLTREELIAFTRMQSVVISRLIKERDMYHKQVNEKQVNEYRTELASMIKRYGDLPVGSDEVIVAWYDPDVGWISAWYDRLVETDSVINEDTPVVVAACFAEMLDKMVGKPVENKGK